MKKLKHGIKINWRLSILLASICALFPATTFAQSSNRWLLVFETTTSMHDRAIGVSNEVQDLVSTGMHGLIRTGDTIGIWAFNEKIQTAPLQIWSPKESRTILRHTLKFVSAQPYAWSAHMKMNEMLTNMLNVVDASPFITIILFTDGDNPVKGTPFDAQINQFFKNGYRRQKKDAMPLITVLRGVDGELTTNTLNAAPAPVNIPSVPPPPPPPPKPPAAAAKPEPPAVPPIIFVGKPETSAPAPAAPAEQNNAAPMSAPSAPATPSNTVESNAVAPKAESPTPPMASVEPVSTPAPGAQPATPETSQSPQTSQGTEAASTTATNESAPNAASAATPAASSATDSGIAQPKSSNTASASRPADAVATGAPEDLFSGRNIAIASIAFTVIVCGMLIMTARRARASQASLITRSLDRERR